MDRESVCLNHNTLALNESTLALHKQKIWDQRSHTWPLPLIEVKCASNCTVNLTISWKQPKCQWTGRFLKFPSKLLTLPIHCHQLMDNKSKSLSKDKTKVGFNKSHNTTLARNGSSLTLHKHMNRDLNFNQYLLLKWTKKLIALLFKTIS